MSEKDNPTDLCKDKNLSEDVDVEAAKERNVPPSPESVIDGKNKLTLNCLHCPSKIMEPFMASFHLEEKSLPKMSQKKDRKDLEFDTVSEWFVVEDIMTFENIGVSNAVDETKYLTCADCEMGPVGWTDLSNKKCYVALCRVRQS